MPGIQDTEFLGILFTYLCSIPQIKVDQFLPCSIVASSRRCAKMSGHSGSQKLEKFTMYLFSLDWIQGQFKIVRVLNQGPN